MIKYKLQLLLLLIFSQNLWSQSTMAHRYTMANGLPSNEVFAIHKDKKGYIWIGTDSGLSKFDGKTFKTFTTKEGLCENTILEIKEDNLGRIWSRGFSGLFTIIDNNIAYPAKFNTEIIKLNVGFQFYQFEFDDKSNLYVSSRSYGKVYKSMPPYKEFKALDVFFENPMLFQVDIKKFLTSSVIKGNINPVAKVVFQKKELQFNIDKYTSFPFCRNVSTSKCLLFSIDKKIYSISLTDYKINDLELPFRVSSLQTISENVFLIGGFDGQLATYQFNKNSYRLLDKYSSSISSIYYENNACWIATLTSGVYFIPNIHYNILHTDGSPLISILPISKDSLLVLNANSEISLNTKGKKEVFRDHANKKTLMYWQRFDHSQKEYFPMVGTYNYMINRRNKKKTYFNLHDSSKWNETEYVVPIGDFIYSSYYGGLRIYNQKSRQTTFVAKSKGRATCLFGHEKKLYLGTLNGIFQLNNDEWIPLDTHAFFRHRVTAIDKIGKDSLMIATQDNGVSIYNLKTKKLSIFGQNVGLDKLMIQHAYVDEEGKLWIATKQSVHVLKMSSGDDPILLDVVDLMVGDLSIKEVRVKDKIVYIVAGNQVLTISENLIKFNSISFPLLLNEVKINDVQRSLQDITAKRLLYNENTLLFKYQLVCYSQKNNIEYRYQLNNSPWVSTSNNELQLVSLPSKKYNLKIQGRLKNGVWSKPTEINFFINTPFFESWWFTLLLVISSLFLIYGILAYYFKRKLMKRLKEFEITQELESARLIASKSQMNPHFIFNALSSIQNFILKSEKIEAYQYLTDFSTLIRNYLDYSNKDYIKLDKELDLLQTYIKIEQLRIPFDFEMNLSKDIIVAEENIFSLLIQPCLENAIWHGLNHKIGHKMLSLHISKNDNIIEVNIIDNGIGRKQSAIINANRVSKPNSMAINNMHTRINSLKLLYKNNITVNIIDNYDNDGKATGTSIVIKYEIIYE